MFSMVTQEYVSCHIFVLDNLYFLAVGSKISYQGPCHLCTSLSRTLYGEQDRYLFKKRVPELRQEQHAHPTHGRGIGKLW